jgi:hypothetical protein
MLTSNQNLLTISPNHILQPGANANDPRHAIFGRYFGVSKLAQFDATSATHRHVPECVGVVVGIPRLIDTDGHFVCTSPILDLKLVLTSCKYKIIDI